MLSTSVRLSLADKSSDGDTKTSRNKSIMRSDIIFIFNSPYYIVIARSTNNDVAAVALCFRYAAISRFISCRQNISNKKPTCLQISSKVKIFCFIVKLCDERDETS